MGIVSQFGNDPEIFFARLITGTSGIRLFSRENEPIPISLPAAPCDAFDAEKTLGGEVARIMDRYSQMGCAASLGAWRDAGLEISEERLDGGVTWGTALGGTHTFEDGYRNLYLNSPPGRVSPLGVVMGMNNACASHTAMKLGLAGPCHTFSVACSSSTIAIGEGYRRIRSGECTVQLVGGSDASLSYGVLAAWKAMRVLAEGDETSAPHACRPFDVSRKGLVLGEGAGALVLEDWEMAQQRGARIYAEMVGYGTSCDHAHLVRPNQSGQVRALRMAQQESGLDLTAFGHINTHGTATREGDPIEIAAITEVFGAHASNIAVNATKSMHGHMLGATGAVETIATILALKHQMIPPTANLLNIDPTCQGVRHVAGEALYLPDLKAALCNSFAFGGSNAVLAFCRTET